MQRIHILPFVLVVAFLNVCVVSAQQNTGWHQLGNALNVTDMPDHASVSLAISNDDTIYIAWSESEDIYLKFWDDMEWLDIATPFGDELSDSDAIRNLSLAVLNDGTLILGWKQFNMELLRDELYVAYKDGETWSLIDDNGLNYAAPTNSGSVAGSVYVYRLAVTSDGL